MSKGYTNAMKRRASMMIGVLVVLTCLIVPVSRAQQADPGVEAARGLLKDATKLHRDASHNAMLLGLRQLEDPGLLPLFKALSGSPYLSMRIHGQLGAASLSPQRRIDLATLAEIDDQRELVQVLSAAIDDGLIDNTSMATLLTWPGLDLPLRQAIALRLMAAGGEVDTKPFRESLAVELNDELSAAKLLQYALASLLLAEAGDDAGKTAMGKLVGLKGDAADAVIGQTLDAAMRQGFASAGSLGLSIAKDAKRGSALRLLAIQCAMRLQTPGAPQAWQAMFRSEESSAQRIRLAMIALDSAEQIEPAWFDTLTNQGQWIGAIANAGRAIASKQDNLAQAFEPMIATGQPLSVQWVVTYCQRSEPAQGPALIELVINHHHAGQRHHRGRITQAASDAATALCELYPEQANKRLASMLDIHQARATGISDDALHLQRRQLVLLGIARARSQDIKPLAESIEPDSLNDFTTDALRLFIRARHGASLTAKEWHRVSDIIQGVGQLDTSMRLQLGWAYLKHKGQANQAIAEALR